MTAPLPFTPHRDAFRALNGSRTVIDISGKTKQSKPLASKFCGKSDRYFY
jgi:hypothetical protein